MPQKIILVTGATGLQGRAVVAHLLKANFKVLALTREPNKASAKSLSSIGARLIKGDFNDSQLLASLMDEVYGVFSVQNPWVNGIDLELKHGKAIALQAKKSKVSHLVYSSAGGVERKTNIPFYNSKWEIEEYIRKIGLPFTIFRPVFFMENWLFQQHEIMNGKLSQPLSPSTVLQQISVNDIGYFVTLAFSFPEQWLWKCLEIAGDACSMKDLTRLFSEVMGKEVNYEQIPKVLFDKKAHPFAKAMYSWIEEEGFHSPLQALKLAHPNLINLEQFIQSHFRMTK